jgi:hypothetical protein
VSIVLFLNELSCGIHQTPEQVDTAMEQFVALIRHVRKRRDGTSLVLPVQPHHLELAEGYFVGQWLGARPRNVELWRIIKAMRSRAPYREAILPGLAETFEYTVDGKIAEGMRAAHLMDGLLVSLPVDPAWDISWVSAQCEEVVQGDDGNLETTMTPVSIRHASEVGHAETHDKWIKQSGLSAFRTGGEIWEAWTDSYPNLEVLSRVREHLSSLDPASVIPVAHRLRTLDDAVAQWEITGREPHDWGTKVTSESETRRPHCTFTDLDGERRVFELHARFTPGAGRIYFRLVSETRKARIAHIGSKIRPDL